MRRRTYRGVALCIVAAAAAVAVAVALWGLQQRKERGERQLQTDGRVGCLTYGKDADAAR